LPDRIVVGEVRGAAAFLDPQLVLTRVGRHRPELGPFCLCALAELLDVHEGSLSDGCDNAKRSRRT
jgi:hypothetical protein